MNTEKKPTAGKKVKPSARRKARRLTLQAMYQWQIAGTNVSEIESQFRVDNDMTKVDTDYFHELIHEIAGSADELDEHYRALLDRPLADLTPIELAILRIGTYELYRRIDVPYRVVINEAIELAKVFGATESHRYVNGVLDKLAPRLRAAEVRDYKK